MVPRGTHDWTKFIKPEILAGFCEESGLKVVNIQGVNYDVFTNEWISSGSIDSNYIMTCYKP
jgi:2-polyprenyl-6-hydroxyphenyl methylase/3-demethylubiquinone-9 3-methyltransferase